MGENYERPLDEMTAGALDRDPGLNSILLDMATKLGTILSDVSHIKGRQVIIEDTLWKLEAVRLKDVGLSDGVARYFKFGKSVWLGAGLVLGWIALHFPWGR